MAESKAELRARIRAHRAAEPRISAAQELGRALLDTAVAANLLTRPGAGGGVADLTITAYIATPEEPVVATIREAVRRNGGTVLLPIPRPGRRLEWAVDDGCYRADPRLPVDVPCGPAVARGGQGLLALGVDLVLVPALAVDTSGSRIGQGGGYYDRLLADLAATAPDIRTVAVVHDDEVLPAGTIPREEHDRPVPAVLTPTRFLALPT